MKFLYFIFLYFIFHSVLFSKENCENSSYFLSLAFYYQYSVPDQKKSIKYFDQYLTCNPKEDNSLIYLQKFKNEFLIDDFENSEKTLNILEKIDPSIRSIYILKIKLYYKTNRIQESIEFLEENIHRFPEDIEMIYFLGYSYFLMEQFDFSKLYFTYLDEIFKSQCNKQSIYYRISALNFLIQIYLKTGEFEQTLLYLTSYLKENPYDYKKILSVIKILNYIGRYEESLEKLKFLRNKFKKNSYLNEIWIEVLFMTGSNNWEKTLQSNLQSLKGKGGFSSALIDLKNKNLKKSEKKLLKLHKQKPQKLVYLRALSSIYKETKQHKKQKKILKDAIFLAFELKNYTQVELLLFQLLEQDLSNKEKFFLYQKLADLYEVKKEYKKSIQFLEKSLIFSQKKDKILVSLRLSYIYQLIFNFQKSEEILKGILQKNDKNSYAFYLLGLSSFYQKKYKKAITEFTQAIEIDDRNSLYYYYRANTFEKIGDKQNLERDLLLSIQISPELAFNYNFLGYFYANENIKLDEAVSLLKKAVQKSPNDENYQDSLGWAYFQKNEMKKSFLHLNLADKLLSQKKLKNKTIYEHIADIYGKKKNFRKAEHYRKKARELQRE